MVGVVLELCTCIAFDGLKLKTRDVDVISGLEDEEDSYDKFNDLNCNNVVITLNFKLQDELNKVQ